MASRGSEEVSAPPGRGPYLPAVVVGRAGALRSDLAALAVVRIGRHAIPRRDAADYRPEGIGMVRAGSCFNHEPHATEPLPFMHVVGDPSAPVETWAEGLSMFHNPRALVS